MNLRDYIDSTYLKTAEQAGISEEENLKKTLQLVQEAIEGKYKLAMILPEYVSKARAYVDNANSKVLIGTVIDFPKGSGNTQKKMEEAKKAIENGADELDFVVNYKLFQEGNVDEVRDQIWKCSKFTLDAGKTVKWIIEVAALSNKEIIQLTTLVKKVAFSKFTEKEYDRIFVKSSTGFYPTEDGKPNGATISSLVLMLENANPLPVKAAGGIRNRTEAEAMVNLGVKRLGTSSAKAIVEGQSTTGEY